MHSRGPLCAWAAQSGPASQIRPAHYPRKEHIVAKFLVVHPVGTQLTLESGAPIGKAIKAGLTVDAYWTKSNYAREIGKLYCQWDAKDAASILQVLADTVPDLPTEGPYELDLIVNSEDFR